MYKNRLELLLYCSKPPLFAWCHPYLNTHTHTQGSNAQSHHSNLCAHFAFVALYLKLVRITLSSLTISESWKVWIDSWGHWENVTSNISYESITAARQGFTNNCCYRRFPNSPKECPSIWTCEVCKSNNMWHRKKLAYCGLLEYFHRSALHSLRECFTSEKEFRKQVVERLRTEYRVLISGRKSGYIQKLSTDRAMAIKQVHVYICMCSDFSHICFRYNYVIIPLGVLLLACKHKAQKHIAGT